jgi:hypothetical protein
MLTAEELHDAVATATGRPGSFGPRRRKTAANAEEGEQPQTVPMAMQVSVPSPSGELKSFMQAFGQANRGTPARPAQPSPLQPIVMMRSSVVTSRVLAEKDSRVQRLLGAYSEDSKVVEELFLATLARKPNPDELALGVSVMGKNRVEGAQNVQWALLNLAEFLYNF